MINTVASVLRKAQQRYLRLTCGIWRRLPNSWQLSPLGQTYGRHLHFLVLLCSKRRQSFGTFFLRNRPELQLMRRLVETNAPGSSIDITVLACSKGPEVYSILWTIRSARPDLRINMHAVDISREILQFAEKGVYSRSPPNVLKICNTESADIAENTYKGQDRSIFERLTDEEVEGMFEVDGEQARIRSWLKDGITWLEGDAGDRALTVALGPQDMVVANRFLCHMKPAVAERYLGNIARLVKPGGYLFVSGIDLEVRTRVAGRFDWKPVTDLIKEIHEGDPSLREGWPLDYWGLEPFCKKRPDWKIRYASVFQIGKKGSDERAEAA
jgi:chemotaxis methyl-accepting protein methylase